MTLKINTVYARPYKDENGKWYVNIRDKDGNVIEKKQVQAGVCRGSALKFLIDNNKKLKNIREKYDEEYAPRFNDKGFSF